MRESHKRTVGPSTQVKRLEWATNHSLPQAPLPTFTQIIFFCPLPLIRTSVTFFTWLGLGPNSSHHLKSPPVFLQPRQQTHPPCLVQRQATIHPPWHQPSIQTTQRTSSHPSILPSTTHLPVSLFGAPQQA